MKCPKCGSHQISSRKMMTVNPETGIVDTVYNDNSPIIYRRRICNQCGHSFTTYEIEMNRGSLKALKGIMKNEPICPVCKSDNLMKVPSAKGIQVYACRDCKGLFSICNPDPNLAILKQETIWKGEK